MIRRWAIFGVSAAIVIAGVLPIEMDRLPVSDKALHVIAFAAYALVARISGWGLVRTLITAAVLAAGLECLQGLLRTRVASAPDWLFSVFGAVIGAGMASLRRERLRYAAFSFAIAGVVGADAAIAEIRPAVTARLLDLAWESGRDRASPASPWPGAARVALRLGVDGQDINVVDSASRPALAIAPGVWSGRVDLDQNLIVLGHRNKAFRKLADLRIGDVVTATTIDGRSARYEVTATDIVPWNRSGVFPSTPAHALTLVTCWPVDAASPSDLRLVVRATEQSSLLQTAAIASGH